MHEQPPTTSWVPTAAPAVTTHYTFDDFREATLAVQRRDQRLARDTPLGAVPADYSGPRRWGWHQLSRVAIGLLFPVLLVTFVTFRARLPGFLAARPDEYYLLRLAVPIALYFLVSAAIMRLATRAQNPGARLPLSPIDRRATVVAVVGYSFAAGACALTAASADDRDRQMLLHELMLMALPWVVIFLVLYLQHVEPMKRAGGLLRWRWDATPGLHVEKTIAVDDVAFHLSDANARYELRWHGLTSIEETENLFTRISRGVFYMLPKRVLTPDQVAFVRSLSDPQASKPTGGFPVLPPKS
jgi:hypothetical protein